MSGVRSLLAFRGRSSGAERVEDAGTAPAVPAPDPAVPAEPRTSLVVEVPPFYDVFVNANAFNYAPTNNPRVVVANDGIVLRGMGAVAGAPGTFTFKDPVRDGESIDQLLARFRRREILYLTSPRQPVVVGFVRTQCCPGLALSAKPSGKGRPPKPFTGKEHVLHPCNTCRGWCSDTCAAETNGPPGAIDQRFVGLVEALWAGSAIWELRTTRVVRSFPRSGPPRDGEVDVTRYS